MKNKSGFITLIVGIVFFAIVIVLVVVDSLAGNSYKLVNNTDKNITSLTVFFDDDEGEYSTDIFDGQLAAGETVKGKYETIDCTNADRTCSALVEFEGEEEMYIYGGYFVGKYNGNVSFEFYCENGEYRLAMNSGVGLFNVKKDSGMEDVIYFDFDNDEWDYVE